MIKTNYHTHTVMCDGKDTAEELVLAAIDKGFSVLGFSGHSPLVDADWGMKEEELPLYKQTVNSLKEQYKDKIQILCGIEHDFFSTNSTEGYDYIIGSVHCLETGDGFLPLDDTADVLINGIDKYFGGDSLSLAEKYFDTVCRLPEKTGCQIIGHLDLITKFDEKHHIFDTSDPRYFLAAKKAIKNLASQDVLFEINTGAMGRGLRTTPYPAKDLLTIIRHEGGEIVLNSDCHDAKYLDYGFEESIKLAKECGFTRLAYLSKGSINFQKI